MVTLLPIDVAANEGDGALRTRRASEVAERLRVADAREHILKSAHRQEG